MMLPKTVIDLLDAAAVKFADDVIYEQEDQTVTFSQAKNIAVRVATKVAEEIIAGQPVIVWASKTVNTAPMYMGVLYAACYYVPIGEDAPLFRIEKILETTDAKVILTDGIADDTVAQLKTNCKIIKLSDCKKNDEALVGERKSQVIDSAPQYVIFTSGSSGTPKGVITSHLAVMDLLDLFISEFDLNKDTVLGNQAPFEYIAGVRDMYIPLVTGCRSVIIPKRHFSVPINLGNYLNEKNINTIFWASAAFSLLYDVDLFSAARLDKIKKLFFAGSVLHPKIYRYLRDNMPNCQFVNHYGPTEVTASCSYYTLDKADDYHDGIPIGKAVKNRKMFLLGEDNKLITEPGKIGEICVSGNSLALGYINNPAQTTKVFIQNPSQSAYCEKVYKTGDLGSLREDGNMMFHGRADNQIKYMGHRIEFGEIEFVANTCKDVGECVCVYDTDKGIICLFYTGKASVAEIAKELRRKLPPYMVPRKLVPLSSFPRMFNGKIDMQYFKAQVAR